jgi:FkbM family methyltransferase
MSGTLRFLWRHPLARGRRWATLRRFLAWQVASRVFPGESIVPFVDGSRLIVARGRHAATGNLYVGLHEFVEMAFTLHALRAEDLFVDVGANVGAYTLLASACAGARTLAFEPAEQAFGQLRDNVRLNAIECRVRCLRVGLGARAGTVSFSRDEGSRNRVLADTANGTHAATRIEVQALDDVMAARGERAAPRLLKLDVEGYEGEVLAGAARTLSGDGACALVLETGQAHHYGHSDAGIERTLRNAGFAPATYCPLTRTLVPRTAAATPGDNVIFVRGLAWFQARVQTAPVFDVHGRRI